MYLVLNLIVVEVNKYYLLYKNMYNIQRKMSIFKPFCFHLPKKEPEPTQKNRLQLKF